MMYGKEGNFEKKEFMESVLKNRCSHKPHTQVKTQKQRQQQKGL